jgi:hypothetical protein
MQFKQRHAGSGTARASFCRSGKASLDRVASRYLSRDMRLRKYRHKRPMPTQRSLAHRPESAR